MQLAVLDDASAPDLDPIRFTPCPPRHDWPPVPQWDARLWTHWLREHHRVFHSGWTDARIAQYLQHDRYQYGLGFQTKKGGGFHWFYLPVPAAIPLHASKAPNLLYGGAVGGSKSYSLRWDAYRHCLAIPRYRSILMRRTFEELKRNHMQPCLGECEQVNAVAGTTVMEFVPSEHELRFPLNGSLLTFGHCQNLGDEERYLGPSYDDFRPDEMATFEKQQIIGVAGRLRTEKPGLTARLVGSSNPGGAHTLWLKEWFIDHTVSRAEHPLYRPADYAFIPARLYDNPFYMDPDGTYDRYVARLYAYARQRRKQLLDGDWSALTGQFFEEWHARLHVAELPIPGGCKIERWIDWGYAPHPGVCHWVACFPNGRLYVFAEWVFNGQGRQLQVAGEVAARIRQLTRDTILPQTKGTLGKSVGDPSMFAKSGHTGESYAETFARAGVRLIPGDNDRVLGWGRIRHWLRPHPEGGAWLMYHPECPYAIRTIPALIQDPDAPDDLDTHGEDHAADADRYGVMARPSPTVYRHTPAPTLPDSIAALARPFLHPEPSPGLMVH